MRKNSGKNSSHPDFACPPKAGKTKSALSRSNETRRAARGGINRILDANLNRASEGLRVCEEITRFILGNQAETAYLKKIRHEINSLAKGLPAKKELIKERNAKKDIGKNIYVNELKRGGIEDVFLANIQRVKEAIRVLEEFSKLCNMHIAIQFKKIRYSTYEIEKRIMQLITADK